ncbi:hypothetical protein [Flavisphingomonas formosensis]|uniref:hypothetical protein n=1 Tax=Flavisphingomonas formosensis TaxID=861534 RepID=UPI001E39CC47|nr:hypothetical protein [Sphingomonas formosensis]
MKSSSQLMAGASRFAHFAGLTRASRRAADDDQDKDARAEEDERDDDASEEDDEEPKGKKGKGARRAEDDDGDGDDDEPRGKKGSRAEDDDGDDEEPKSRGKRSRRAEDDDDDSEPEDDDDKEEMNGRSAKAAARRRERARCAAIFAHPSAARNVALAASLAFETTMTRKEAIAVLRSQADRSDDRGDREPQGNRHARTDRSARNVSLGGDAPPLNGKAAVKASWDTAFKKAGVATR